MLNMKKILAVALLVVITATALPLTSVSAAITGVYLSISAPSASTVKEGGSVSYTLNYTGADATMNLTQGHIGLYGFTGNVSISQGSGRQMIVTISNVRGTGAGKYITVNGGTAISKVDFSLANGVKAPAFTIEAVDNQKPVLTISNPNPSTVTEGGSVSFTLNYTDNVAIQTINLTNGHIGLYGFTGDVSISGTGLAQRVVTISNIRGTGSGKYITVNGGTAIDTSFLMADGKQSPAFTVEAVKVEPKDTEAPVLKITGPSLGKIKNGATLTYVANYTDNVGIKYINLNNNSITLNGFTANVSVSGTGLATRTITLSNITGAEGTGKNISITGGTAVDAAGNLANAATSETFEIYKDAEVKPEPKDTEAPVLKITGPSLGKIKNGATLTYVANYTDNVGIKNINLSNKNITLNGFKANVSVSGTGLATRTITLSNITGAEGTGKNISITGGTAVDAAGNLANAATSETFEIYKDGEVEPQPQPQPDKPSDWVPNPNTGK